MKCLLDRNDELFASIAERCLTSGASPSGKNAVRCEASFGKTTEVIEVSSYAAFGASISVQLVRNAATPEHLPSSVDVFVYANDFCDMDRPPVSAGNRVCERDAAQPRASSMRFASPLHEALQEVLESLAVPLTIGCLSDKDVARDGAILSSAKELLSIPIESQQTYPTESVAAFFHDARFDASIEDIFTQFRNASFGLSQYFKTPYAARPEPAPALFVARRTAGEIVASGFLFGCGDYATLFMAMLTYGGIDNRLVKTVSKDFSDRLDYGHDLVEVYDKEAGSWVLTDPTVGNVYRCYAGEQTFSVSDPSMQLIRMDHPWDIPLTSNWSAGIFNVTDLAAARRQAMKEFYDPAAKYPSIECPGVQRP
jgi:hypothetical protein